jgi:hypothetical protein
MSTKKTPSISKDIKEETQDEITKFRGKLGPRNYAALDRDPNFEYRYVITTYESNLDPYERVEQFLNEGWQVVYSDETPTDERSFAPDNSKETSERLKPVNKRLRGGHNAILLKCSKEQREKNDKKKAQERADMQRRSLNAKSQRQQGNNLKTDLGDVNLDNLED